VESDTVQGLSSFVDIVTRGDVVNGYDRGLAGVEAFADALAIANVPVDRQATQRVSVSTLLIRVKEMQNFRA
jgi:hypothetical protein